MANFGLGHSELPNVWTCPFPMTNYLNTRSIFHRFHYVRVTGSSPEDVSYALIEWSLTALVLHTDMGRTGWIGCCGGVINR